MMRISLTLALCAAFALANAQPMLAPTSMDASSVDTPFSVSNLFSRYKTRIFQIRVINNATGQKTSIGSGFIIGDGAMLATNYHVISDAVQKENHRLEYVDENDQTGELELLDVDVVHDLAVVKAKHTLGEAFELAEVPPQGAPLYALGNPHDLGFIIVDGINNGLLKKSAQARILFSGALNGGMSGGPTLNQNGQVVGINVSYLNSGNNISFIVPSDYLKTLIDNATKKDRNINQSISEQLFTDNEAYYTPHLKNKWQQGQIGQWHIPLSMSDDVRCWDSSPEPDVDDIIDAESISCFNDRETFINSNVTIGQFGYSYTHYYAIEPILTSRFYRLYSQAYQMRFPRRPQRDYGDFDCQADFITLSNRPFKATLCRQPSKNFAKDGQTIDDMRLMAAELGQNNDGLMIEIALYGVQTKLGKAVMQHILEQITWQK